MDVATVLLHILVVVIAAKIAAEVAERLHTPAVVGEIVAGLLIGPSALHLVGNDDVLTVLGQLGVILLLLQVGLEMDLAELWSVGRASLLVASAGVIAPMVLGVGVATAFGHTGNTALFVGAALTATSVGITARVFGDLRALATPEARTVLGAAVADDVMGLVILTVVVRIVTAGSVSYGSIFRVIAIAVGFLVIASIVGITLAPRVFALVERWERSAGTLLGVAFAFTLAFAELADKAKLAPIVGAFVAGLALSRAGSVERIRREMTPVGHLLIPVFFLEIGIDAKLSEFAQPSVIGLAAALLVVAVIGKLVSPVGAIGSPGDKMLIGLGMIPRGEVGLIFATIGLQNHILGQNLYAAVLLVVLATTLVTPPLLRWRLLQLETRRVAPTPEPEPKGGWWRVDHDVVDLAATPPEHLALALGMEAAFLVRDRRPGAALLDWFSAQGSAALLWTSATRERLFDLLQEGNVRSWRFLEVIGLLERALPELAEAVRVRQRDPIDLDPASPWRFTLVDQLRELRDTDPRAAREFVQLVHPEWLLLAALILESVGGDAHGVAISRRLVNRLDLGIAAEEYVALLVGDSDLFIAAIRRRDATSESVALPLAAHLDQPERARALYLLVLARWPLVEVERARLDALYDTVQQALARPDLTGIDARNLLEGLRLAAQRDVGGDADVIKRVSDAPRAFVTRAPDQLAPTAIMIERARQEGLPAVDVVAMDDDTWEIKTVSADAPGLLARLTGGLHRAGFEVASAVVATWPDGIAYDALTVRHVTTSWPTAPRAPDPKQLASFLGRSLDGSSDAASLPNDLEVVFEDKASPWYTLCRVRVSAAAGLFSQLAERLAAARVNIISAVLSSEGSTVLVEFELTDRLGAKISPDSYDAVREALAGGRLVSRRGWRRLRLSLK